jgi:PIN domain nuclease of toxin-antitoxin system
MRLLLDTHAFITRRYAELAAADGFEHLSVTHLHALHAGGCAVAHRDPFDRMLAAQSELEPMPLITRDPAFQLFGIETRW